MFGKFLNLKMGLIKSLIIYIVSLFVLTSCHKNYYFDRVMLYNYDVKKDDYTFIVSQYLDGNVIIKKSNFVIWVSNKDTTQVVYDVVVYYREKSTTYRDNNKYLFKCHEGLQNNEIIKICLCERLKVAYLYLDLEDDTFQTSYIIPLK
jgi:hypothetical protein